jgi:hypothetical protein
MSADADADADTVSDSEADADDTTASAAAVTTKVRTDGRYPQRHQHYFAPSCLEADGIL